MKAAPLLLTLMASLILAGCATDPFSTEPEVDIDPDKVQKSRTADEPAQ